MTGSWLWQALGWVALALNVWGNLALTGKGAVGWIIRLASNACWIAYSIDTSAWALLANHSLFTGINVYGWAKWRRALVARGTVCGHPFCEICTPAQSGGCVREAAKVTP